MLLYARRLLLQRLAYFWVPALTIYRMIGAEGADKTGFGYGHNGIAMNREQRRRAVRQAGGNWRREMAAKRAADASDRVALQMSPEQARKLLAEWAARPGRSQADVDALNGKARS